MSLWRNFTGFTFVGKVGTFAIEFSAGMIEEITLNMTSVAAAGAVELPKGSMSKEVFIRNTSIAVGSKVAQTTLVDIIAGATPNLLI